MKKKIAILGANSHIAKGLIFGFAQHKKEELFLFARTCAKVKSFLKKQDLQEPRHIHHFKDFGKTKYDVVINCVGLGTPAKVKKAGQEVFRLTEEFDYLVLQYLQKYPDTLYINFSSGAIYQVSASAIKPEYFYGIAKLQQEARHRELKQLKIVDVRVFSYFSRFIDLDAGYFLTDLIKSLKDKKTFTTNACDFTRDYLAPQDLFCLISRIILAKPFNGTLDAYSARPVSKFKLLEYFAKHYSLKIKINRDLQCASPTGEKARYYSGSKEAADLVGYQPKFTSLETVADESKYLLGASNG